MKERPAMFFKTFAEKQIEQKGRDYDRDTREEYVRGKHHGADDLRMSQNHCRALQRELDEARRENAKLKVEIIRLTKS